ncbi:transcription factor, RsfA family [Halobacillus karajensis]|uniref:Prespore-specific transcriptional regulator RsfA n=1 Tax=Halobacillus karajensis TaxID=195088 RepID=A0A024P1Z8_9BACI|nr:RsfA family transcriptional regulator [Halobacillus karajensis]CDQ19854.1 Prespore-specific transcriptional regulator RsfA [Halobacillus karajensis]CDQ22314.1 Prespore-specific transcriptional regulator RsfA [Halobacillus karajensis]CDQ28155.1 Prespore-specific transcriptional regulator RsfA [Halobacillus karajensis]SEH71004.1 transcription factor, RsfA family [Halobacillus karajensis]
MDAPRQDAWKEEEDLLLATTVLKHIREGKTQLEAFQEVAEQLHRTPAACGFRWNATVRKKYQKEIQEAKNSRKSTRTFYAPPASSDEAPMSLDAAISFLKEMKSKQFEEQGKENLESKLKKLNEDNEKLRKELKQWEAAWNEMDRLVHWVREKRKSESGV